jgi:N-acetylmuramoyl-L-alanine amidase
MKFLLSKIIIATVIIGSLPSFSHKSAAPLTNLKTVVIDAGHGGSDVGAVGQISKEKEVTLQVSKILHAKLKAAFPQINFVMTRTTDVFDSPTKKANKANDADGDLFICIHVNSAGKPGGHYANRVVGYKSYKLTTGKGKKKKTITKQKPIYEKYWVKNEARGTETFIWASSKTESKEEFIKNRFIGYGDTLGLSSELNTEEEKIMASVRVKKYFLKSLKLADYIEEEYIKVGRVSRGVKQRNDKGIWVLQATAMPSVLTEIGFNSNTEEEKYLTSSRGQNEIADCIVKAFTRYKQEVEK